MSMALDFDASGANAFFTTCASIAVVMCFGTLVFIVATSSRKCPSCVPRLSLHTRDPTVLSLLGACGFGIIAAALAITGQRIPSTCYWLFKLACVFYSWSYWCVNLFLLAKLRAVVESRNNNEKWYVMLHKMIYISTLFGSPIFGIVAAYIAIGRPHFGKNGSFFCVSHASWIVSVVFLILQLFISVAYLILFTMPLMMAERRSKALRAPNHNHPVHAVIIRNLISCISAVGCTSVVMSISTGAASYRPSYLPGMWAMSLTYLDIVVNIASLLYAIHPAWRYERSGNLHALPMTKMKRKKNERVDDEGKSPLVNNNLSILTDHSHPAPPPPPLISPYPSISPFPPSLTSPYPSISPFPPSLISPYPSISPFPPTHTLSPDSQFHSLLSPPSPPSPPSPSPYTSHSLDNDLIKSKEHRQSKESERHSC